LPIWLIQIMICVTNMTCHNLQESIITVFHKSVWT
jgi:hypothetical protein